MIDGAFGLAHDQPMGPILRAIGIAGIPALLAAILILALTAKESAAAPPCSRESKGEEPAGFRARGLGKIHYPGLGR